MIESQYKTLSVLPSNANIYYSDPIMGIYIYGDDIQLAINDASIFQAIHNIVNTRYGERLMRYEFGIDLSDILFESSKLLEDKVEEIGFAIEKWDNRIKIIDAVVDTFPQLNAFNITILLQDTYTNQTKRFGVLLFS
jgi:phage baseplate assembly protein W